MPTTTRRTSFDTMVPVSPLASVLGVYRGYTLRRRGTTVVAVKYSANAHGKTVTLHRLVGDFDNTVEAKNAVDAALNN